MAKYDVTYSCGHEGRVALFGPYKDRESKLAWYRNQADCPDCFKKALEEKRASDNAEAVKASSEKGLPKLQGSDKQIAWAEKIRIEYINKLDDYIDRTKSNVTAKGNFDPDEYKKYIQPLNETVKELRVKLLSKSSASWWIDNRGKRLTTIYEEVAPELVERHNKLHNNAVEYLKMRAEKPPEKPKMLELPAPSAIRIQSQRSKQSQNQDASRKHSIVISPDSPKLKYWVKDQGSMDVQGIDTPTKRRTPKMRLPKMKKPDNGPGRMVRPHIARRGGGITRRSNR